MMNSKSTILFLILIIMMNQNNSSPVSIGLDEMDDMTKNEIIDSSIF